MCGGQYAFSNESNTLLNSTKARSTKQTLTALQHLRIVHVRCSMPLYLSFKVLREVWVMCLAMDIISIAAILRNFSKPSMCKRRYRVLPLSSRGAQNVCRRSLELDGEDGQEAFVGHAGVRQDPP